MLHAIVDTNVVVSAIIGARTSPPALVVAAMLRGTFVGAASDALLDEYLDALAKPRLFRFHELDTDAITGFVDRLRSLVVVHAPERSALDCPDPKDQHLWDLLATVPDSVLVTGETTLLQSRHFPGRILPPRDFASRYLS